MRLVLQGQAHFAHAIIPNGLAVLTECVNEDACEYAFPAPTNLYRRLLQLLAAASLAVTLFPHAVLLRAYDIDSRPVVRKLP